MGEKILAWSFFLSFFFDKIFYYLQVFFFGQSRLQTEEEKVMESGGLGGTGQDEEEMVMKSPEQRDWGRIQSVLQEIHLTIKDRLYFRIKG